ncbi:hypothetical protein AKJ09_00314 [Labilithrix luteola]|uniref:Uncharacterized protein n=1 Tax=Labilithrix luteola TaxID=1391654 RepID=A0A0K1PJE8_9BACT|nr:hypothetical protein AKJ09_00314 [Labilithrix luteola]
MPKQPASEHVDGVAAVSPLERYYPGSDDARTATPLKRYTTAVVLFAPPRPEPATPLERIETLSFQPVVCVIAGRIQTGVRCGEVMPRRTTVRLTAASSGYDTMEIMRSTTPFTSSPEDGTVTFPAPYAPACCMYKGCAGKTIPYRPAERQGSALATSRTILAVWPEDADIDLVPLTPETDDPSTHPWKAERSGARKFLQLATSDLDRDGRPEILVYELWANDYGLDVFANGSQEPIYRFSCGNI